MEIVEKRIPFKGYHTYVRIVGGQQAAKTPLIVLHGGPGSTHNYLEMLDPLAKDRQIIMYDQLGCGLSYVDKRPDLWHEDTWMDELENVRQHLGLKEVYLLGQSWGGMLIQLYLLKRKPTGVRGIILSSTLSSAKLWSQEQHRLIGLMSESDQKIIAEAETKNDFSSPLYLAAEDRYMERYCSSKPSANSPSCVRREKVTGHEAYVTAWGPNEFTPNGTLKDYDVTSALNTLDVPTLIISGVNDLSTPLLAKTMHDNIRGSKWELFPNCRHCCYLDDNPRYLRVVSTFLKDLDK